jgi:hypothetical protein
MPTSVTRVVQWREPARRLAMSAQDVALVTLALAVGVCALGVEIMGRLAARSFPNLVRRRFGPLNYGRVAG